MAKRTVTVRLDKSRYREPTQEEIEAAKRYVLRRDAAARGAWSVASDYIMDAAEQIVRIAYRYDIPAESLSFDSSVSEGMMDEIAEVMDELDEALFTLLETRAVSCAKDPSDRTWLIALLLTLGHRNMSLRETLRAYEWRMLHQIGALTAGSKYRGLPLPSAIQSVKHYLGRVNRSPSIRETVRYREMFASPVIRSGGKTTFPDGSPNVSGVPVDGYNAIRQIYGIAIAQIWMKNQLREMEREGCAGYIQMRGSLIPCALCDSETGFHEGIDINEEPYPHPNCMCYRVPVYRNGEYGEAEENNN